MTPDLLHSRLVEKKPSRVAKPVVWGAILGAAAVFLIAFAVWDLASQRSRVEDLKKTLANVQPGLKAAQETVSRVTFEQKWFASDPVFLACLRDVTAAFPDDVPVWATRLTLHDDGRGSLEGQAASEEAAKSALRGLQQSGRFTDVKPGQGGVSGGGRNVREGGLQTFSVTFRFNTIPGASGPPTNTAAAGRPVPGARTPSTSPAKAGAFNDGGADTVPVNASGMNTAAGPALDRTSAGAALERATPLVEQGNE